MSTILDNPTDDQLNAAFAEHVAGWKPMGCVALVGPGDPFLYEVPGERQWRNKEAWTRSMDAVLPWLEKHKSLSVCRVTRLISPGVFDDQGPLYWGVHLGDWKNRAEAGTPSKAAVIALLRANGVTVNFTHKNT